MRIVAALGGNALLRRGEPLEAEIQRANVQQAARGIAELAQENELVLTHGNGPQVASLALLAEQLKADQLLILTDVSYVERGWRTPTSAPIESTTPSELRHIDSAAGSMGPKVEAACRFVERTGGEAVIGSLVQLSEVAAGRVAPVCGRPARPRLPKRQPQGGGEMTLLWFIVWVIAGHIGSHEPLRLDPVNVWTATLLLAVALDLGRAHAASARQR